MVILKAKTEYRWNFYQYMIVEVMLIAIGYMDTSCVVTAKLDMIVLIKLATVTPLFQQE